MTSLTAGCSRYAAATAQLSLTVTACLPNTLGLVIRRRNAYTTGQQMATFVKNKGVNVTKLTNAQIRNGRSGARLGGLTPQQRTAFLKDTPLWFYILREAELNQGKLKGVGARIVAETFHHAMEGSRHSIVRDTSWRPTLGPNSSTFFGFKRSITDSTAP